MKINYFQLIPYRRFASDFEAHHGAAVDTPYALVDPQEVRSAYRDALGQYMHAARRGFDGLAVTEHSQSAYDMLPNPSLICSALAHATDTEGLATAIHPLGRSLGKAREPLRVAEEMAMIDCISGGRLVAGFPVGLAYDASMNNGVPPAEVRARFDENLELVLRAWTDPEPFAFNGRFSQHGCVNIWPRPLQSQPPVWITGIGNPNTMKFVLSRGFGFNYFSWFGTKATGPRIFNRFYDIAAEMGVETNPYQMGFMQMIAVAETDAEAERLYAPHAEYFARKALGAIPMNQLALPGGIDIRGLEFIFRDPKDFGAYAQMKTATYRDLVDSGALIAGSPETVAQQLRETLSEFRIGNLHAMLHFGSMPRDLAEANIDLFADRVMPKLRDLWEGHDHHWWPEALGGAARPETNTPMKEAV
ncbi:Luciferase-like monooxygenase [Roseivivax jejudonensis]|uniref:Luciferase-like monooxygenase n=1 Tax=Roseivivax jejudonensis TaxID=1529041 RepID=A0A1X7A6R7_9RHOB|nr:LLM class flavin-dependent oxidoreductase [Roseivivax jejudonensis]SLN71520.1 Luciferase-like monooxygenase [Roseivivax jejudonensis]